MKLLVCVSKTPDTTSKIAFTPDGSAFDPNGVQFIMNPYDEWYALVRALELKEQFGGTVTLIHVGPAANDVIIRKGLAIGADDAVRINLEPKSSINVAKQIATYAKDQAYDIVFLGKETIDYNGSEIGAMISEYLELPFVSFGIHMELDGNTATIKRDVDGGEEELAVDLPFVVSAAKGMAEQRIPNMRGIMMSKRKPITVVDPIEFTDPIHAIHYELPPEKSSVKLIDPENMDELVRLLHEEAKVI